MTHTFLSPQAVLANYYRDLLSDENVAIARQNPVTKPITPTQESKALAKPNSGAPISDSSAERIGSLSHPAPAAIVKIKPNLTDVHSLSAERLPPITPTLLTDAIFTPLQKPADDVATNDPPSANVDDNEVGNNKQIVTAEIIADESANIDVNVAGDHYEEFVAPDESVDPILLQWADNGRPAWAQTDFDALLLEIDNFTVAVPLIALGKIQPLSASMRSVFGQAPWFMGIQTGHHRSNRNQSNHNTQCRVVNTALFIMPERYNANFPQTAKYIVSIDGLSWALAVTKVDQPIRLHPGSVRWRKDRANQPWAAGVVKEHMCVLIDIPQLGKMLLDSDKNRPRFP